MQIRIWGKFSKKFLSILLAAVLVFQGNIPISYAAENDGKDEQIMESADTQDSSEELLEKETENASETAPTESTGGGII